MQPVLDNITYIVDLGFAGALIVILYGGAKGWWVYGGTYKAKEQECDEERNRANEYESKYVNVLISDIEERKRDRANLDLMSQVVRRNEAQ